MLISVVQQSDSVYTHTHVCEKEREREASQVVLVAKNLPANAGDVRDVETKRHRFDPRVGEIPWRRAWQPTPVFLPGETHGQRSLAGYSSWGHTESDTTGAT